MKTGPSINTAPLRVAIYARFSSDLQNDRSCEDQIVLCRDYAKRHGWNVAVTFHDAALSGATIHGRKGYQHLLSAASRGKFDIVLAEDLDRLSRNIGDIAKLYEELNYREVGLFTVADGAINEMHVGLKGTMSALFLKNLALKVRRGMSGALRSGRIPGGKPYGYKPVKGEPGVFKVEPAEADIVRRIYAEYIAGKSARDIAADLNSDHVPPPRGAYWRRSTLYGDNARAYGILQNEVYIGKVTWNKTRKLRDPSTGKYTWRANPEPEWQRNEIPHLRIIDDETFMAAAARRTRYRPHNQRQKVKRLLTGLLQCGCCGAGMHIKDRRHGRLRVICTQIREAGTCNNRRAYYLDGIEQAVAGGMKARLGEKEAIDRFLREYDKERRAFALSSASRRPEIEKRLSAVAAEISRTVTAVVKGLITDDEAGTHLPTLREEASQLKAELAAAGELDNVHILLPPKTIDDYIADVSRLEGLIVDDIAEGDRGLADRVRNMIDRVTIDATPTGQPPGITVDGRLVNVNAYQDGGASVGAGGGICTAPPPPLKFRFVL